MPKPVNPDGWTPTALSTPDGRGYTPASFVEEQNLLLSGYRKAPAEQAPPPSVEPAAEAAATAPEAPTEQTALKAPPKTAAKTPAAGEAK